MKDCTELHSSTHSLTDFVFRNRSYIPNTVTLSYSVSSTIDFVCSVCTQVHGPQDYRMQLTGVWIAATIMIIHELSCYSQLTFTVDVDALCSP